MQAGATGRGEQQLARVLALAEPEDDRQDPVGQRHPARSPALRRLHRLALRLGSAHEQARSRHLHDVLDPHRPQPLPTADRSTPATSRTSARCGDRSAHCACTDLDLGLGERVHLVDLPRLPRHPDTENRIGQNDLLADGTRRRTTTSSPDNGPPSSPPGRQPAGSRTPEPPRGQRPTTHAPSAGSWGSIAGRRGPPGRSCPQQSSGAPPTSVPSMIGPAPGRREGRPRRRVPRVRATTTPWPRAACRTPGSPRRRARSSASPGTGRSEAC